MRSSQWSGEREFAEPELAKKLLEQQPVTAIAALDENKYGRIRGKVMPLKDLGVLIAPVSGRSCVAYLLHVESVWYGQRQHWGERRAAPFIVVEDGHRAVVDPAHASLRIRYEQVAQRVGFSGCTPYEQELLRRLGVPADPFASPPFYIFQEARLEPGHVVTACGMGVREADPDAPPGTLYRGMPKSRLLISAGASSPVAIANDPELTG